MDKAEQPTTQADRDGPAPLEKPVTLHCLGCRHLKTKWWKDYLDNDETDSGTSARCGAIPDQYGGKSISAYWTERNVTPKWCPHIETANTRTTSLAAQDGLVEALDAVGTRGNPVEFYGLAGQVKDALTTLSARVETLEAENARLEDKAHGFQSEVESLVRGIAARKTGRRDIPSLYEWTARNWPTDWQLNGGNATGDDHG